MAGELVVYPAVKVVEGSGLSTVIYDPVPHSREGTAGQVQFGVEDKQLTVYRKDGSEPLVIPTSEIGTLRIAPEDSGSYEMIANLPAGGQAVLLAGIPDIESAVALGRALRQQFSFSFLEPAALPRPEFQKTSFDLPPPEGTEETAELFLFASRPSGRALLGILGVVFVFDLLWLVFAVLANSDLATTNPNVLDSVGMWLDNLTLLVFVVNVIAFLYWIYRVHQDLRQLVPKYPISPRGAVARTGIPVYNAYGIWEVFNTMSENFMPDFEIWARLVAGTYAAELAGTFWDLGVPDWAYQLLTLSVTAVWIVVTIKVQRALAEKVGEPLPVPGLLQEEEVGEASDTGESEKPSRFPRKLKLGLTVILLTSCSLAFVGLLIAVILPAVQEFAAVSEEMNLYDENYSQLIAALSKRWNPDDTIPNASADFSLLQNSDGVSEVWLVINLETTEQCTAGATNPCERLANEFAGIVLDAYPRVNELDGLQVSVTRYVGAGPVSLEFGVDKAMTIDEWRQELSGSQIWDPFRLHQVDELS